MEDTMNQWTNAKLCDIGNLILGGVLFLSPWMFNYPVGAQSQNAFVIGIIIAVLSVAALAAFTVWEEVINLIAGLWLIVSPWVLKFEHTTAMRVNIVIGIIVVILAAIELWSMWQSPPRQVANR
jgi:hypothetical protein